MKFPWKQLWALVALVCFVGLTIADRQTTHWVWLLPAGLAALTLSFLTYWGING